MLPLRRRSAFAPPPTALQRQAVPVASTMIGSLVPLLPFVATEPIVPPLGLVVFLGWRLLRANIWPLWAGLPLGLWDDLFSGQPLGSSMCAWTAILLVFAAIDHRAPWRDHRQDWALATLAIAGWEIFAFVIARLTGTVAWPQVLLPQLVGSAALFPLTIRICAALDRWRHPSEPLR